MNPAYIAIDPGGTTGVATLFNGQYETCTCETPEQLYEFVKRVGFWDTVIIERFATSGTISKYGLYTVELVGGVKALCWSLNIQIAVRMPQQRYAFQEAAEQKLKGTKHVIHETEALAHLLAWEYKQGKVA